MSKKTDFSVKRIRNWEDGHHIPELEALIILSETFGKPIDWLLGIDCPIDKNKSTFHIPRDDEEYWHHTRIFVDETIQTLWMRFSIMPNISRLHGAIARILKQKNGHVRIIISDPNDVYLMEMIARHGYRFAPTAEAAAENIRRSIRSLIELPQHYNINLTHLEIVTINEMPSTVMYLSDARIDMGRVYLVTPMHSPMPTLSPQSIASKNLQPDVFEFYYQEYLRLWKSGTPLSIN